MSEENKMIVLEDDTPVTNSDISPNQKKLEDALKLLPTKWAHDMLKNFDEHKILLNDGKTILFVNHIEEITKDAAGRVWIAFALPRRRDWNVSKEVLNDQIPNKNMGLPADTILAVLPFTCKHDGYLHLDICGDCNMPVDDIMRIAEEGFPTSKRFIDSDPSIEFANYGEKEFIDMKVPAPKYNPGEKITLDNTDYIIHGRKIGYTYDIAYPNDAQVIVGRVDESTVLMQQHHIKNPNEETTKDES